MLVRLIFGLAPLSVQPEIFLFLGAILLAGNLVRSSAFGVRCSFVLSAVGLFLVEERFRLNPDSLITFLNGLALLSLLAQPVLLARAPRRFLTGVESWLLVLLAAGAGWLFINAWVAMHPGSPTFGWALYALFLFFFGLLAREHRLRRCGLVILAVAFVRLFASDIWGFSNGGKILTLVALTLATFALGSLYARCADRLKTWW